MKTLLHNLNKFLQGWTYIYGELTELDEYDVKHLQTHGVDEAWYWYSNGGYEGSGQILIRNGDKYELHDMGHCSCYGPTDNLPTNFVPFAELRKQYEVNAELWVEVRELFDAAQGIGVAPTEEAVGNPTEPTQSPTA